LLSLDSAAPWPQSAANLSLERSRSQAQTVSATLERIIYTSSFKTFTHSMLRTTEEILVLPLIGGAVSAASMRAAFHV
jgi:hypothetical protein